MTPERFFPTFNMTSFTPSKSLVARAASLFVILTPPIHVPPLEINRLESFLLVASFNSREKLTNRTPFFPSICDGYTNIWGREVFCAEETFFCFYEHGFDLLIDGIETFGVLEEISCYICHDNFDHINIPSG